MCRVTADAALELPDELLQDVVKLMRAHAERLAGTEQGEHAADLTMLRLSRALARALEEEVVQGVGLELRYFGVSWTEIAAALGVRTTQGAINAVLPKRDERRAAAAARSAERNDRARVRDPSPIGVSVNEAAAQWGVTPKTAYRWIDDSTLPAGWRAVQIPDGRWRLVDEAVGDRVLTGQPGQRRPDPPRTQT